MYDSLEAGAQNSVVGSETFSTLPIPGFVGTAPNVNNISQTTADFNYQANQDGTLYWVVYLSVTTAPDFTALKTPTGSAIVSGSSAIDDSASTTSITSLTAGTAYKLYYSLEAGAQNSVVGSEAFSTLPIPGFVGTAPNVNNISCLLYTSDAADE